MNRENEEKKIKLERELRFLKESLDSDIISKHEYERSKERIDKKLSEIQASASKERAELSREGKETAQAKIEIITYPEEQHKGEQEKQEELRQKEAKRDEREETKVKADKYMADEIAEEKPIAEEQEGIAEEKDHFFAEKEERLGVVQKSKKSMKKESSRLWMWFSLFAILVILGFYIYSPGASEQGAAEKNETVDVKLPLCSSDVDCHMEGMAGVCNNPSTSEAKCEYTPIIKLNMTILTDMTCSSCDTASTIKIISNLFPGVDYSIMDINSEEGRKTANKFKIKVLPAYIFDSKLNETYNYEKVSRIFVKRENVYLMSLSSSGAGYYFKREKIANKMELFAIANATNTFKAEDSMKDVIGLFGDKLSFETHLIKQGSKNILSQELGINTYPTWLVNNQYKFNGVFPSETMKQRFCDWNDLKECSKTLSMDLK